MNIKTIVTQYLNEHGYDGLYLKKNGDECGCSIEDLMPCDVPSELCAAGYQVKCGDGSSGCIGINNDQQ